MNLNEFNRLPREAAWRLEGVYQGFEYTRFAQIDDNITLEGTSLGVEDGVAWKINYFIRLTSEWLVRYADITSHDGSQLVLEVDARQDWNVNGKSKPQLQGCIDLDLAASTVTNTIPIHRLSLLVGSRGESQTVYIATDGLKVQTLDQSYKRLPDNNGLLLYEYWAPRFDYHDTLKFKYDGLIEKYPEISQRVL